MTAPVHPTIRRRVLRAAWRPCVRGLPLPTLAGVGALAAAPTLVVAFRSGSSFDGALTMAALVSGAALAFTVDDPAEETLAASPTSLARRRGLRASALGLGVAATALALVAIVAAAGAVEAAALGRRAAELAATGAVAAALAGSAHRRAVPGPAHGAAVGSLLGVLLVAALAQRVRWLPSLLDSPHHGRWWLLAAAASGVAAWTWRDPAR